MRSRRKRNCAKLLAGARISSQSALCAGLAVRISPRKSPLIRLSARFRPVTGDQGISGDSTRLASAIAGVGGRLASARSKAVSPIISRFGRSAGKPDSGIPWAEKARAICCGLPAVRTAISRAGVPSSISARARAAAKSAQAAGSLKP